MTTMTYVGGTLTINTCWCGLRHAIPTELSKELDRNPKQVAYCPVGHEYVRGGKSADQLRAERAEARARHLSDQLEAADRRADTERRRAAAFKGQITKARKRVGKGTCPCCNRHFPVLRDHMATKHPEYCEPE